MWLFETKEGIAVFIVCIVVAVALFAFICCLVISHFLYRGHLTRRNKNQWSRKCSQKEAVQMQMYEEGLVWGEENAEFKKDVHIVNDGLNLYGEYYDFGFDRALFFVCGRTEGLRYGYYFVKPYRDLGFNVLLVDARAHGLSDGKFNTIGFEEHKDLLAWAKFLHEEHGVQRIVFHAICIGSSCALMALTSKDCPEYLQGLIAEGMYPNFYESYKYHMAEFLQPEYPVMPFVRMWMKAYTGYDMKFGNIDIMDKMNKPLLMIHSKEDKYSLPSEAQKLYDKCPCEQKALVWFEHGKHSKLRILDPEYYDNAIREFMTANFPKEN